MVKKQLLQTMIVNFHTLKNWGIFLKLRFITHAYASYEKGAIENANRLVRQWYKKGLILVKSQEKIF